MSTIAINCADQAVSDCLSVIIVPEQAVSEAGYIQVLSGLESGHGKHEFHALAQTAYFQYQDEELDLSEMRGCCRINRNNENVELSRGALIIREHDGSIKVFVHAGCNVRRLLEAAHRYCTRWVRLDI